VLLGFRDEDALLKKPEIWKAEDMEDIGIVEVSLLSVVDMDVDVLVVDVESPSTDESDIEALDSNSRSPVCDSILVLILSDEADVTKPVPIAVISPVIEESVEIPDSDISVGSIVERRGAIVAVEAIP
jgi:hypothetical protein